MFDDVFVYCWGVPLDRVIVGLFDIQPTDRIRHSGFSFRYFEFSKRHNTHEIKRTWLDARAVDFKIATAARVFARPVRVPVDVMGMQYYHVHFEVVDNGLKTEVWKFPFALYELPELHHTFRTAFSEIPSLDWEICLPTL